MSFLLVLRSGNGWRHRLGGLERLVAQNRVACVEQHPFATEPLVQLGVPYSRQNLGVQADQPTHNAAFRRTLLALDEDLQSRVFEIWYPAHVQSQHARLVLLSLIHISEPTRLLSISYAVFCL